MARLRVLGELCNHSKSGLVQVCRLGDKGIKHGFKTPSGTAVHLADIMRNRTVTVVPTLEKSRV